MSILAEIVKNILFIIILASFLEIILPDGSLKPFVRFTIGLFILISVLNPILSALFSQQQFEVKLWDYRPDIAQSDEILEKGRNINQQITKNNNAALREKLQGQISSMAMLVPGVKGLETRMDLGEGGNMEKLHIMVKTSDTQKTGEMINDQVFSEGQIPLSAVERAQVQEKIMGIVKNLYGLQKTDIEIEFEGS